MDGVELFSLLSFYDNAAEIASRPRGEMQFADDMYTDEQRRQFWPFDIEAFEEQLEKQMVRDEEGLFRRVDADGTQEAAYPTIRWVNNEIANWAIKQLDGRFKRITPEQFCNMSGVETMPEETYAWWINEEYVFVLSRRGGNLNMRDYSIIFTEGMNFIFEPAYFTSFPSAKEMTAVLRASADPVSANNLAVLVWSHRINSTDMNPLYIRDLLEAAQRKGVLIAERNLSVLKAHIPEVFQEQDTPLCAAEDAETVCVAETNEMTPDTSSSPDIAASASVEEAAMETLPFKQVLDNAERGDAKSQVEVGRRYLNGEGVEQDDEMAFKWFQKAAEQGYAIAQSFLGQCYLEEVGVEKDEAKAIEWFQKAAEQGYVIAQTFLGCCYFNGIGVEKDETKVFEWFQKAAEQGYAEAQRFLGQCYLEGFGVEEDETKAFEWFQKAAEQGDSVAQVFLGGCYFDGTGVKKDATKGFEWFQKAAEQGEAVAQYELGNCYLEGTGVEKDEEKAAEWFQKAAAQGYSPDAQ